MQKVLVRVTLLRLACMTAGKALPCRDAVLHSVLAILRKQVIIALLCIASLCMTS